jgi:hypothetical protein
MPAPMVFTAAMIRELDHDPQRFLVNFGRRRRGSGFGYPQEAWRYGCLDRFHAAGRDLEAAEAYLAQVLAGGDGPTNWKRHEIAELRAQSRQYALPDQRRTSLYLPTPVFWRPSPVAWRGHVLALRPGLTFERGDRLTRLVWTAKKLSFARPGATMVVAATLAQLEASGAGAGSGIEVYQLRYGEERWFSAGDLKGLWSRLDRLLTMAEARPEAPPAA